MRIHRSAHVRAYTVVSNTVLQDNQLSFVARGVLGYLLSLRDGAQVDVRTLAKLCKTGRDQIAGALNELKARGYYVVERVQDTVSGQWVTRTVIREDPQAAPAAGEPDAGAAGRTQGSTGGKVPPSPGRTVVGEFVRCAMGEGRPGRVAGSEPRREKAGEPRPHSEEAAGGQAALPRTAGGSAELRREDAALVRRLGEVDRRLRIGEAEAAPLVPLIAQWRERGVGDSALVHALTAGLPPQVFVPVKFVASRLVRKLPPQAVREAAGPPVRRRPECPDCARPLPEGAAGRCRACERPTADGEPPWASIARNGRARVRAALAGAAPVIATAGIP
ncbi:helix-turn-helix domain-containing protein [Streptomyces sp.]|uniref:helix-turn-helix domain-containing protein n=1 Tax=Streptomyces sp. TaxID=1931 RepID=UPI002F3F34A3